MGADTINRQSLNNRLAQGLALLCVCAAVGLSIQLGFIYLNTAFVMTGIVCLALFALMDLLSGQIQRGLWAGYLHLTIMLCWLALGTVAALWVILLGAAIVAGIRRQFGTRFELSIYTPGAIRDQAVARTALSGSGLLVAAILYQTLGGRLPLTTIMLSDLVPLGVALVGGLVATQIIGQLLVAKDPAAPLRLAEQRPSFLIELVLLCIPPTLSLVLYNVGPVAFAVILGLTAIQAVRYRQLLDTRQTLMRRVQELATLSSVGQTVSNNLALDEVLMNVYTKVRQLLEFSTFIIGLYDEHRDVLDYRLVIEHGQPVNWPLRDLSDGSGIIAYVIHNKTMLHIHASEVERLRQMGVHPSELKHLSYLCFPLMSGPKIQGLMAILSDEQENAFGKTEIEVMKTVANQAGLAIRNAVLYERSAGLSQNLSLINRSVQDVMFNLDSDDAMRAACETALEVTDAGKVAIFLLDTEKKNYARLAQSVGLTDDHREAVQVISYNPKQYENGPVIVQEVSKAGNQNWMDLSRKGNFQAFVEVPLRSGNTVVGLMTVYHAEPHYYRKTELDLLETLAYQVTAALDNAELLKALELYASEQAQLVHLSRISAASLDLKMVVSGVSEILRQMMGVTRVNIGLLMPGKGRIRFYETADLEADLGMDVENLPLSFIPELQEFTDELSSTPKVFRRDDPHVSPEMLGMMVDHSEEMLVLAPMIANNRLVGVVLLGNTEVRFFADGEWRLVEMAANQIASQIHNAQQYTLTNEALKRRLEQLSVMERIAQQISSALDFDDLIANVLEAALYATQADMVELALMGDDGKFRIIGQEMIEGDPYQYQAALPMDAGLIGQVAKSGETTVVRDNRQLPNYVSLTEIKYLSSLAVPLIKSEQTIGVLNMQSVKTDFFTEEKVEFINSLAGHAMISIENARLLEEQQYQIEALTNLRQLSLLLSNAVNRQSVNRAILRAAIGLLRADGAVLVQNRAPKGELVVLGSTRMENSQYINVRIAIPEGILRQAIEVGEIEMIADVTKHPRYDGVGESGYASLVVVPIRRGRRVRELLCITFAQSRHFNKRDYNTVELLAIQVAGHVENAMLMDRIRAGNNRMQAILNSTRDGVILLDQNGDLRLANPSAERLLELNLEDHVGENFATLLLEHTETNTETSKALTESARTLRLEPERITSRQYELKIKGQPVYVEEVGSPVMDSRGHIIGRLLVFRDVTDEQQLAEYREEITYMAVHDLKAPLGTIISSMSFVRDMLKELKEEEIGDVGSTASIILENSMESGSQLTTLVESLLDIAKLERRELILSRTPVPISSLIDNAAMTLKPAIQDANIALETVVAEKLPDVDIDEQLIRRVVINLLGNAIKFTPLNGTIQISAAREQDRVIVRVADSGRGIPPEERERVFEKFRQVPGNKPHRGGKGTGLGLTLCKLAVEAHGERIWIEEQGPLPGACFAFTLPVVSESNQPKLQPPTSIPAQS